MEVEDILSHSGMEFSASAPNEHYLRHGVNENRHVGPPTVQRWKLRKTERETTQMTLPEPPSAQP